MSGALNLSLAFQDVRDALLLNLDYLNSMDSERGRHGEEMVSLFTLLAAAEEPDSPQMLIADLFERSAQHASSILDNLSAQFYVQGLACFADALRELNLTAEELPPYLRVILADSPDSPAYSGRISQGQLLKALIKGLSSWDAQLPKQGAAASSPGMGYLFDLGIAYLQARQQNASKLDAVVDVAVQHSPLKFPAYRAASGKLVLSTLLSSILSQAEAPALPRDKRCEDHDSSEHLETGCLPQ